ncbi:MAG: iron ABC transporter permease [Rhodopseudomonas sp.]|uniref:lipocalin-like domain-containing protein n=1 Tax=Rhodopseudomonas sp. TaxID=1078 RepID=UPI0018432628|nr:lipocalin-like domain-containing protein [Rhodopseudomonas sp.]NVN88481.1 iron ABC transporter permease [Rhodopseudomonas sp.]
MSASFKLTRRGFAGGLMLLGLGRAVRAQGFAGLGGEAGGFAPVLPGRPLTFPTDHGPHPEFRIEWWYLTANLTDANGAAYGAQWTLFRQAMAPGPQRDGWANQQIWMGHAAVTSAATHRYAEAFARGGVGQAGVTATPFRAWIDAWEMRGGEAMADTTLSPLDVAASAADFSYTLRLTAERPLVLQGDSGYSRKSERGQASYYYSQPFFAARGSISIDGKPIEVTGRAWMDREWSSQPLSSDQTGWDWFSLHLQSGEKLMLFRLRQADGRNYFAGNWIGLDGKSVQLSATAIEIRPTASTAIGERQLPTSWRIAIPERGLSIDTIPLNPSSWMGTSFPYWEGPIAFSGSQSGIGYLEMTGY